MSPTDLGDIPDLSGLSPDKRRLVEHRLRARAARAVATAQPEILRRPADAEPVMSDAQRRLYLLDQSVTGLTAYNVAQALHLRGQLDVPALHRALDDLVARHEVLRTRFLTDGGGRIDILPTGAAEFASYAIDDEQAFVREQVRRPFDLRSGRLLRGALGVLGPNDHVLVLVTHHIVSDGVSKTVLAEELSVLYGAHRAGVPPRLPEPALQYADYAAWQTANASATELDWWRTYLDGAPDETQLPIDRPRSASTSYAGAKLTQHLDAELASGISRFARASRATLFMVLLAAFAGLLERYSAQGDVVIGSATSGRHRDEVQRMVGLFLNQLPLRIDTSGNPSFAELVERARDSAIAAYSHQNASFDRIVEQVRPARVLGRNPIFQTMLTVKEGDSALPRLDGLEIEAVNYEGGWTKFDLLLVCYPTRDRLDILWQYSTDLFDEATIRRLSAHLAALLRAGIAAPTVPLGALALATDADRTAIAGWNATDAQSSPGCLHERMSAQAARTPDAYAVGDGDGWITYRELNERANRLAHHLVGLGVQPDSRVAIHLERSIDLEVAVLAVLGAGGAYVPLDPGYPPDRLAFMLDDCGAVALVTTTDLLDQAPAHPTPVLIDRPQAWAHLPASPPTPAVTPENLAYVIYTSGTTGRPKGVCVEHRSVVNQLDWMQRTFALTEHDTVLQKTPFSFDVAGWEVLWTPMTGARLYMARPGGHLDPRYLIDVIGEHGVTVVNFVPSMLAVFAGNADVGRCTSLRLVVACGEALPDDVKDVCLAALPHAELHNLYGPTETAIAVTYEHCLPGVPVTIGRPSANTRAMVVDDAGNPQPVGMPGELWVSGVQVARGYLDRPELTAQRFVGSGVHRAYRTGDRATWLPDGRVQYLGRADEQVKLRGFRVELGEIEAVLSAHPAVAQSCVVVATAGSGDPVLAAYVVLQQDAPSVPAESGAQLDGWNAVWDEKYDEALDVDPYFDTRGWSSSFTGKPIPEAQMAEWVDNCVARIVDLGGDSIVEIGAGTGLLMWRLAPKVSSYVATDFSAAAVAGLQRHARQAELPSLSIACLAADEVDATRVGQDVDTVVLNSVVQYFPDADYLTRVLERCLVLLAPGGRVFVGDVRDLRLHGAFAQRVEATNHPTESPLELQLRVADRCALDAELLIDPAFFFALPGVSHVQVLPKRGIARTEMNGYRYDVVLHIDTGSVRELPTWVNWSSIGNLAALERLLAQGDEVGVRSIPDARVAGDVAAHVALGAGRIVEASAPADAVEPETLWELAHQYGYDLELSVRPGGGRIDAAFTHDVSPVRFPRPTAAARSGTNDPTAARRRTIARSDTTVELAALARERLPEYMVPSSIRILEHLPVSPAGKLDRRALSARALPRPVAQYIEPSTTTQIRLANLWQQALGLTEPVSAQDSFFDLGGNSLLALTLFPRIEREFRTKLALSMLFENVTVASQAAVIDAERTRRTAWNTMVVMRDSGSKQPLFVTPELRGDVLTYRQLLGGIDPDRPVYGIQCIGLDGRAAPRLTIEDIAQDCIEAIRRVQPAGPYLLAGYCFGGVVAYEIAARLLSAGEQVDFLGVVDATPFGRGARRSAIARPTLVERFTVRSRQELRRKITFVRAVTRYRVNLTVSSLCGALHIRTPHMFVDVRAANMRASRSYVTPDSPARVTLFRASTGSVAADEHRRERWEEVAKGGVQLHTLTGEAMDHYTIIKAEQAVQLAEAINSELADLP